LERNTHTTTFKQLQKKKRRGKKPKKRRSGQNPMNSDSLDQWKHNLRVEQKTFHQTNIQSPSDFMMLLFDDETVLIRRTQTMTFIIATLLGDEHGF